MAEAAAAMVGHRVDGAVSRVEGIGNRRPYWRLRVKVDGLLIYSAIAVQEQPVARLVESLGRSDTLQSQVQRLWSTRRGRSAWLLFVEVLATLNQHRMPTGVQLDFCRRVFWLTSAHFAMVLLLLVLVSGRLFAAGGALSVEGRPFVALLLSFAPQATISLLGSKHLKGSYRLSYAALLLHTVLSGFVWGLIETALGDDWLRQLALTAAAAASLAAPLSAGGACRPEVAVLAGWLLGTLFLCCAYAGASPLRCDTALSGLLALGDLCWCCRRPLMVHGNPDRCFGAVASLCRAVAISTHMYICVLTIARLLAASPLDSAFIEHVFGQGF